MRAHPHRSASDLLVELVHGGLRLRDAYKSIHRYALEARADRPKTDAENRACLQDTFSSEYVEHVERWLEAEGVRIVTPACVFVATAQRARGRRSGATSRTPSMRPN